MASTLLVVDDLSDWTPYYPSDQVITFEDYLAGGVIESGQRIRVINLCSSFVYLADGYYCSLLAEARNHHVIPSLKVINDLGKNALYRLQLEDFSYTLGRTFKHQPDTVDFKLYSYFGNITDQAFHELARLLFERFPCPILEITLQFKKQWQITDLKAISHRQLDDAAQTLFADALDRFSKKVWRKSRTRKAARYDLAILINPTEKLPPSNRGALKKFINTGRQMGIEVELITQNHFGRIPEFDGLFIRETTAIDH
ncbi:MAG: RimK-like ATPgrasp N-terminal domain-containing protein, partial [Methylomonas sp.]